MGNQKQRRRRYGGGGQSVFPAEKTGAGGGYRAAGVPGAVWGGGGHPRSLIAQAYAGFNAAKDPDLIESYVFEINALQARYSYLLRRVKELDGEAQAQPG